MNDRQYGPPRIKIRLLGPGDEAPLRRCYRNLGRGEPPSASRAAAMLATPMTETFLASVAGEPVGWAVTYLLPHVDGTDMVLLYDVEVQPEYRRRGIGRRLVDEVLRRNVDQRRRKLWLITPADNEPAIRLYREVGGRAVADVMFVWADLDGRGESSHV